eukprot:1158508-Pelagomonas_calceolata.AAC.38
MAPPTQWNQSLQQVGQIRPSWDSVHSYLHRWVSQWQGQLSTSTRTDEAIFGTWHWRALLPVLTSAGRSEPAQQNHMSCNQRKAQSRPRFRSVPCSRQGTAMQMPRLPRALTTCPGVNTAACTSASYFLTHFPWVLVLMPTRTRVVSTPHALASWPWQTRSATFAGSQCSASPLH